MKFLKRIISFSYVGASLGLFFGIQGKTIIEDALLKRFDTNEDAVRIEIGSLSFYFSQKPNWSAYDLMKKNQVNSIAFFFPDTSFSSDVVQKIQQASNQLKAEGLVLVFKEVSKPKAGLRLTITYDPEKVEISHKSFDSMRHKKGLEINFFSKTNLEKIKAHQLPVFKTVLNQLDCSIALLC